MTIQDLLLKLNRINDLKSIIANLSEEDAVTQQAELDVLLDEELYMPSEE